MIARQTGSAALVLPHGQSVAHHNVFCGAASGAHSAMHAFFGIHSKWLVGNHFPVEESTHDMGQNPWDMAFDDIRNTYFPLDDSRGYLFDYLYAVDN